MSFRKKESKAKSGTTQTIKQRKKIHFNSLLAAIKAMLNVEKPFLTAFYI
jgi:hypothetical protein